MILGEPWSASIRFTISSSSACRCSVNGFLFLYAILYSNFKKKLKKTIKSHTVRNRGRGKRNIQISKLVISSYSFHLLLIMSVHFQRLPKMGHGAIIFVYLLLVPLGFLRIVLDMSPQDHWKLFSIFQNLFFIIIIWLVKHWKNGSRFGPFLPPCFADFLFKYHIGI